MQKNNDRFRQAIFNISYIVGYQSIVMFGFNVGIVNEFHKNQSNNRALFNFVFALGYFDRIIVALYQWLSI